MPSENLGGWLCNLFGLGLFGILWLAIGSFLCVGGVIGVRQAIRLSRYGVHVTARIVGIHVNPTDAEQAQYLIVEFSDLEGTTHRRRLPVSSSNDPPVGHEILVVYNPNDPSEVSGATFGHLWMIPLLFCVFGPAGILMGVGVVWHFIMTS